MPENLLKWLSRPNVVRIEEHVEATAPKKVVKLDCSTARLDAAVTHEHATLLTQEPNAFEETGRQFSHFCVVCPSAKSVCSLNGLRYQDTKIAIGGNRGDNRNAISKRSVSYFGVMLIRRSKIGDCTRGMPITIVEILS